MTPPYLRASARLWPPATSQPGAWQDRRQSPPSRTVARRASRPDLGCLRSLANIISPRRRARASASPKVACGTVVAGDASCDRLAVSVVAWPVSTAGVLAPASRVVLLLRPACGDLL